MILVNGVYVREHRYLAEIHLGHRIPPKYDVVWLNGDRRDNRLQNLGLVDHARNRVK